jgi:hypothetical protein
MRTAASRAADVRERIRRILGALAPEDLEDRVAPVKCNKHPDSIWCDTTEYAVPAYGVPEDPVPGPEGDE